VTVNVFVELRKNHLAFVLRKAIAK